MARNGGPLVVCVINLKGGVGKSTISVLLARYAYTVLRRDVLAIDLDPQANMSQAFMLGGYSKFIKQKRPSIVEIFKGYIPPSVNSKGAMPLTGQSGVETLQTMGANSLQLIPSRFDFSDNLLGSIHTDERALAKFLSGSFDHKDLIIIDCSPTESIITRAAYHASGLVLIPVKPEFFATIGFPLLRQSLESFRQANQGHQIDVAGIVINNPFYDGGNDGGPEKREAMKDIAKEAFENSWRIFENEIPFSRGFPKKMRGDYSYSGNSDLFWTFAKEFFDTLGLQRAALTRPIIK